MTIRKSHVAGTFYPADPAELRHYLDPKFTSKEAHSVKAVMLPHAGYVYSGETACRVLDGIEIPKRVILLGPDHWARGGAFSVYSEGAWQTPLGKAFVDSDLAGQFLARVPALQKDLDAHAEEHSLEVIVPMLQTKREDLSILPILLSTRDLELVREAATAIVEILKELNEPILIVVSSDMNHYESDDVTRVKDRYAIDALLALDRQRLEDQVSEHKISMCGFLPAYMLLSMAEALGITKAELIDYQTSAKVSGDLIDVSVMLV